MDVMKSLRWKKARTISLAMLRTKASTHLRMEQFIVASGKAPCVTALESNPGLMARDMKANGKTTRHMAVVCFTTWMATSSMGNGTKTRRTASEPTSTSMARSMRATGLTICKMARARRRGKMDLSMRECTVRA